MKKLIIVTGFFTVLLMLCACGAGHSSAGTSEAATDVYETKDNESGSAVEQINVSKEQVNKLFDELLYRMSDYNERGKFTDVQSIVPLNDLVAFESDYYNTPAPEKFLYSYFKCNAETYIIVFYTDRKGEPNQCVGMISFTDIIPEKKLLDAKRLEDVYILESNDKTLFWEHYNILKTMESIELPSEWTSDDIGPLTLHCTDKGLYVAEYNREDFIADWTGVLTPNMDCEVLHVAKYEDGLFSKAYEDFVTRNKYSVS